jgi:hypothetical protein
MQLGGPSALYYIYRLGCPAPEPAARDGGRERPTDAGQTRDSERVRGGSEEAQGHSPGAAVLDR